MSKQQSVEYQHFSNLIERVAVITERLEHVCRSLEQYKVEIKDDIKEMNQNLDKVDVRVRYLEDSKNNTNGKITGLTLIGGAIVVVVGWIITTIISIYMKMPPTQIPHIGS